MNFKDMDRFFIGFDKVAEKMSTLSDLQVAAINKYPPYNIKKIEDNKYTIEMAVAGFSRQDLEIELAGDKLIVKGSASVQFDEATEGAEEGQWSWPIMLYQGLAMRPFTRTFNLADNVEIRGATLLNGILKIALEAIIPEHKKPKKVEIQETEYPSDAAECIAEGKVK